MPTTPINISSLEFDAIKTSLVDYLKTQEEFNGYPFSGTALSTLLDVLAYNTLYYGYYSNMIANETFLDTAQLQQNITALLKPLGYTINGVNCSKIYATGKGTQTLTEYETKHTARAGELSFDYYTIQTYSLSATTNTDITLYEGTVVSQNISSKIDTTNQQYYINDTSIDINTIAIYVNGIKWTLYNSLSSPVSSKDKTYFIDRNNEGFYILFSKYNVDDVPGKFGTIVNSTDTVVIKYIKPSGASANGAVLSTGLSYLTAVRPSSGGGAPNLDTIKSFVPKLFSSSERAVTRNDYEGIILQKATELGLADSVDDINVWGGDELQNPLYGRVFYSINDPTLSPTGVKDITTSLKDKSIITVTPEYVPSNYLNVLTTFRYRGTVNSFALKQKIDSFYSGNKFNKIFKLYDISAYLRSQYETTLTSIWIDSVRLTTSLNENDTDIVIGTDISSVESTVFEHPGVSSGESSFSAYLKSVGNVIYLWKVGLATPTIQVGSITNQKGIIILQRNVGGYLPSSITGVQLTMVPTNKDADIITKNQFILNVNSIVLAANTAQVP